MQEGAPGWKVGAPLLWRAIAAAKVHAQIRATKGSYALSPLFIDAHHIKIKPGVGRTSLYSHLVMGQSALAETGGGWNRAYATIGRTASR